jgi:3-methyladenine DNA glycosylase/8-oxoguanine DNA glycosylase
MSVRMKSVKLALKAIPPFNFDCTVYVPHYFPTPDSQWQPGVMWQTLNLNGELFGLKMEDQGTINDPKIRLAIFSKSTFSQEKTKEIVREIEWRYGLRENISGFFKKFEQDRLLKPTFERLRGMRNNCANSLYELLMISIVLQNATVKRTVQMMNNLFNSYGTKLRFDAKKLFAYWRPEDLCNVSEDELRLLKVGYRAKMIKSISEAFANHEVDESKLRRMKTSDAKKELMKLYGVGPATAEIILSGYLRRYDTFDLRGKFWEQKILSRVMFKKKLVSSEEIAEEFDSRYGKWKGLAFHYILTDLFWRHREKPIPWLKKEIRL